MDEHDNGNNIIDLLKNIDLAYSFKKKRLRYIQSAAVSKEIVYLRDNFYNIWIKKDDQFYLKDPALSKKSIEIVKGLFGDSDKADSILSINLAMVALDRERINEFLSHHIASKTAQKNLSAILFDGEDSLLSLVRRQIPYFERYIPTMKKFNTDDLSSVSCSQNDLDNMLHFISRFNTIEENLSKDIHRYKDFERDFVRLYHEDTKISVIGYGEISTVMRLDKKDHLRVDIVTNESKWIWKKMPPFPTKDEVDRFLQLYDEYRRILTGVIGIAVPEQTARYFKHEAYYLVYAGQVRINEEMICSILIKKLDEKNANILLTLLLEKVRDVYFFNKSKSEMTIGIDAQLSNWVLNPKREIKNRVAVDDNLIYIDTSSPMIRIGGDEQINPEIFIKSAASFLRPIIRKLFLQEVLDRYYDVRSVIIDIIANLHKEKRADLIDSFIDTANNFFKKSKIDIRDINRKEIDAYYSNDAFIWKFYQASRKIDRFITEKIFRKKYMFRIPEKIER